jgi:hypothetical protein
MDMDRDGKVTEGEANNYLKIIGFGGFDKNTFFTYSGKNKEGFVSLWEINSGCRNEDYSQK